MTAGTDRTLVTARRRAADQAALAGGKVVDVLVVGGGVTGAGVALDAASRGLSVALVERDDLAAGTSRWSSKLAHGGLRYISKGQIGVAWESAVERNALFRTIAPHLVRPMPFFLPLLPRYPFGARAVSRVLLSVADGLRAGARTPTILPRGRWADAGETRAMIPTLADGVPGAYIHVDGALEDDARLVVALARTAAGFGARILTHCRALDVGSGGAQVRDELTGEEYEIRARTVVVAAGVWSGGLVAGVPLRPSRGAHLVLRADALDNPRVAFNIVLPGSISRFVFAVPRPDGTVLVGLTDDAVDRIDDVPQVSAADERWLLEMLSSGLSRPVTSGDVIGRFAGLRPLLGSDGAASGADDAGTRAARRAGTADISRKHVVLDRDGVLVVVGGKLTTYRRMAEDTVDAACRLLGRDLACRTRTLPLVGAGEPAGAGAPLPDRLVRRYGAEAARVTDCGGPHGLEPLAPGVPALRCELDWAVQAEGALTVDDALDRRLRLDLVDDWRAAAAPAVAQHPAFAAFTAQR